MTEAEREWLRSVGLRVRLSRVVTRESQDGLAARAGVSRVTLGSIERGEHPAVVLTYVRIARALGRSLDELLAGAV